MDQEDLYRIANKVSKEGGELVMTTAEKLIERGIEKGERLKARSTAKALLLMGDTITKVSIVTGLSEKEVSEIKKTLDL